MVGSLCVFAFLILSAVARGAEGADDRNFVELVKRVETNNHADGQIFKRAEPAKLSRRQQGGAASPFGNNPTDYRGPGQGRRPFIWNPPIQRPPPYWIPNTGPGGTVGGGGVVSGGVTGSYSYSYVLTICNTLIVQIQSCQNAIISGGINAQIAMQQVQQIAGQFQAFMSQFQGCGPCYGGTGLSTFGGLLSSLFTTFNALVTSCQQYYPSYWPNIFSTTFGGLNSSLASFLSFCQSKGLTVNSFMPQSLSQFWGRVGLTSVSVVLRQNGFST